MGYAICGELGGFCRKAFSTNNFLIRALFAALVCGIAPSCSKSPFPFNFSKLSFYITKYEHMKIHFLAPLEKLNHLNLLKRFSLQSLRIIQTFFVAYLLTHKHPHLQLVIFLIFFRQSYMFIYV